MRLLEERPDLAAAVAARFDELVVDEVQDTSPIQLRCVELLHASGQLPELLHESSPQALADRRDRGRRFKDVLTHYYRWSADDLEPRQAADAIYDWARNPLAHSFGIGKDRRVFPGAPVVDGQPVAVYFWKGPLSQEQVEYLATTRQQDPTLDPTAAVTDHVLDVHVVTLSWGVHELLRRLFEDADQARQAEETARVLLGW